MGPPGGHDVECGVLESIRRGFFYLLFPFLLKWFARLSFSGFILLGILSWFASLAITGTYTVLNPDALSHINADSYNAFWLSIVKFHPLIRLPEFLIGMACGFHFLRARANPRLAFTLVSSGLLALVLAIYFCPRIRYPVLHTSLLAPAFAAIIYGFALQPRSPAFLSASDGSAGRRELFLL